MGAVARAENSARVLTVDDLRRGQVQWEVAPDQPLAILCVGDEGGECKLQSFGPSAHREHIEDCPICLDQLQEAPNETIYVQCVACSRSSYLECVERWLCTCESGACLFCAFCRCETFRGFSYDPSSERSSPRRSTRSRNTPTRVSALEPQARQRTPSGPSPASVSHAFNSSVRSPREFSETSEPDNMPDQPNLRRSNRERRPPSRFQPQ